MNKDSKVNVASKGPQNGSTTTGVQGQHGSAARADLTRNPMWILYYRQSVLSGLGSTDPATRRGSEAFADGWKKGKLWLKGHNGWNDELWAAAKSEAHRADWTVWEEGWFTAGFACACSTDSLDQFAQPSFGKDWAQPDTQAVLDTPANRAWTTESPNCHGARPSGLDRRRLLRRRGKIRRSARARKGSALSEVSQTGEWSRW